MPREETISGLYLPNKPPDSTWDVTIDNHSVKTITPHTCPPISLPPEQCKHSLLLPSLCHAHIHLDKAFLLSSSLSSQYSDLVPQEGTFSEALSKTSAAKARFTHSDLHLRGSWLIEESLAAGVTAMRAFVEIDQTVGLMCVETGVRLKREYKDRCVIQLCAFAQDPIFSGTNGDGNRGLLEQALKSFGEDVEVLGTTPYVEDNVENARRNVEWAIETARRENVHLDFHLDYNQDRGEEKEGKGKMLETVIEMLVSAGWSKQTTNKPVAIGHCTRMTLYEDEELKRLAKMIRDANLSISFVGLPTSDLYMMGRPSGDTTTTPGTRSRGTLQIPMLIKDYDLHAVVSVNNVGNAFTPYGSLDPLWLACLGVGLYHAGTAEDARLLYECISTRARIAIGMEPVGGRTLGLKVGDPVDFMIVDVRKSRRNENRGRQQTTIEEMVWDVPSVERREVYFRR